MKELNRIKLYYTACKFFGTDASPEDKASDDFSCADSASLVILSAFPGVIKHTVSTADLFNQLNKSKDFKRVVDFKIGDIIISPTGMGNGKILNGHVGFVAEDEYIISNDSLTGLMLDKFTISSWVERYRKRGGYPIYFFRKI